MSGVAPWSADRLRRELGESVATVSEGAWPDEAWDRLAAYCAALQTWNRRINLTAARTPAEVSRQIEECLPLLPHLPAQPDASVVDVGAGGGLPGLVLAAFRPDLAWTLIEPIHKKHAFLRAGARAMGLSLETRAVRDDALEPGQFDVALTRATWPMDEWLVRGERLVRQGGRVLGLEGKDQRPLPDGAQRIAYTLRGRIRVAVVLNL